MSQLQALADAATPEYEANDLLEAPLDDDLVAREDPTALARFATLFDKQRARGARDST